jgi:hypothetical protein
MLVTSVRSVSKLPAARQHQLGWAASREQSMLADLLPCPTQRRCAQFASRRSSLLAVIVLAARPASTPLRAPIPPVVLLRSHSTHRPWSGGGIEVSGLTPPGPAEDWPGRRDDPAWITCGQQRTQALTAVADSNAPQRTTTGAHSLAVRTQVSDDAAQPQTRRTRFWFRGSGPYRDATSPLVAEDCLRRLVEPARRPVGGGEVVAEVRVLCL